MQYSTGMSRIHHSHSIAVAFGWFARSLSVRSSHSAATLLALTLSGLRGPGAEGNFAIAPLESPIISLVNCNTHNCGELQTHFFRHVPTQPPRCPCTICPSQHHTTAVMRHTCSGLHSIWPLHIASVTWTFSVHMHTHLPYSFRQHLFAVC